jgi:hypothetical protein
MPEDNPVATVTDSSEGSTHVEGTTLTLDHLNSELGTRYQTVESAVKGLKETKNYVGKVGQEQKSQDVDTSKFVSKDQYEQDMFYAGQPKLAPYKEIINARAKELGIRPADAVANDPALKTTLEKLSGYDETENAKSVLMTPRLGQVTDNIAKANEAAGKGDFRTAETAATRAVIDLMK